MNVNHALIASFERSKQPERQPYTLRLFALALMGLFFMVLITCLAVGVQVYRLAVDTQNRTDQLQMQAGFLSNIVHANDSAGSITSADGPEGDALVLVESLPTGTYETRLYLYEGQVCQEYAIAGRDLNPEQATPLFPSRSFAFDFADSLLSITTDQGTVDIALRSEQGGIS